MKATEILMSEHRNIEKVLDAVDEALKRAESGVFDADLFSRALAFLREYADKRHHGKEEEVLFQLAEEVLTAEDKAELERDFLAFDERRIGEKELAAAPGVGASAPDSRAFPSR